MIRLTRALPWLVALVATSTALALPAASVRAISCDRADAFVSSWRVQLDEGGSADAPPAPGIATDTASPEDETDFACLAAFAPGPTRSTTLASWDRAPSERRRALGHVRRSTSGLERPPRTA